MKVACAKLEKAHCCYFCKVELVRETTRVMPWQNQPLNRHSPESNTKALYMGTQGLKTVWKPHWEGAKRNSNRDQQKALKSECIFMCPL